MANSFRYVLGCLSVLIFVVNSNTAQGQTVWKSNGRTVNLDQKSRLKFRPNPHLGSGTYQAKDRNFSYSIGKKLRYLFESGGVFKNFSANDLDSIRRVPEVIDSSYEVARKHSFTISGFSPRNRYRIVAKVTYLHSKTIVGECKKKSSSIKLTCMHKDRGESSSIKTVVLSQENKNPKWPGLLDRFHGTMDVVGMVGSGNCNQNSFHIDHSASCVGTYKFEDFYLTILKEEVL